MNLQVRLISTCMIVAGLGCPHAIAAEPIPAKVTQATAQSTAQRFDACRQAGAEYSEVYTIEDGNRAITICQKGNKYYYITQANSDRRLVRYASHGTQTH